MGDRIFLPCLRLPPVALLSLLASATLQGQMSYNVSVYSDLSVDANYITAYGVSTTSDNSTLPPGCSHSAYQTSSVLRTPDDRQANQTSSGFVANTSIATDNILGPYMAVGTVGLYCSCAGHNVGAGGPAGNKTPAFRGCSVPFSPGQFNAACDGVTKNDSLFSATASPPGNCPVSSSASSSASSSGDITISGAPSCSGLNNQVSGHVWYYAGNGSHGAGIGAIGLVVDFTLKGVAVRYKPSPVPVYCN